MDIELEDEPYYLFENAIHFSDKMCFDTSDKMNLDLTDRMDIEPSLNFHSFSAKLSADGTVAIPDFYYEVLKSPEKKLWIDAMKSELLSLINNNTFKQILSTSDIQKEKLIPSKWVFDLKENANGEIVRYKARIVARGDLQTYGIDFEETYAPVVRPEAIQTMFIVANQNNYKMIQMDFENAFLNGELDESERIKMKPPPMTKELATELSLPPDNVWLLLKALYGLRQSARKWYQKIHQFFIECGFK